MDHFGDAIQGVINLLDKLGGAVRRAFRGSKRSAGEEWRSRDNTWIGAAALSGIGLLIFGLASTNHEQGKQSDPFPTRQILLGTASGDSLFMTTTLPDLCDPQSMLGYATASPLARRIADGKPWDLNNELASLALIDSFQTSPHRAFYSAILLRTLERADGYYAEPLGIVLHSELLTHPCSMLSCCWENGCDGRAGLMLWANAIAMEIVIDHEEDPWTAFVNYGEQVEARAKTQCDLQTGSRAHEFLDEIGAHLKYALQRDFIDATRKC